MVKKEIKVEKVKKNFYLTLFVFITVLAITYYYTRPQKVVRVLEGNRLVLDSGETICLIGVNPDSRAGEYLRQVVKGRTVTLHFDERRPGSSGGKPAYVYLADGTFVNEEVIKGGYARVDRTSPFEYSSEFMRHQLTAQKEKRGIWSQ